MRPLRLELKGFSAFRERTEVSFEGADLVALVGPTGSGKSSLIDAVTFALYGVISRYDDQRAVEPAIHQLETEARVRLDFEVGGEDYTAVRVVRRTSAGATTKEARLVHHDDSEHGRVLAESAREMAGAVDSLLHLSFEQFTKTVVLPQGDFAAFLREGPTERQKLLRRLLDVELYSRMANSARQRERMATNRKELLAEERGALTLLSDEERRELVDRAKSLDVLAPKVEEWLAAIERLDREVGEKTARLAAIEGDLRVLQAVTVPEGVVSLATDLAKAKARVRSNEERREACLRARDDAETAAEEGPTVVALNAELERLRRYAALRTQLVEIGEELVAAESRARAASVGVESAATHFASAETTHQRVAAADLAGTLALSLEIGQLCPVCRRAVDELPDHDPAAELADAVANLATANTGRAVATQEADDASRALYGLRDRRDQRVDDLSFLEPQIRPGVDEESLGIELERARKLESDILAARRRLKAAEKDVTQALKVQTSLQEKETAERRHLTEARDAVAHRQPLNPGGTSLYGDWTELAAWARTAEGTVSAEVQAARTEIAALGRQGEKERNAIEVACAPLGIEVEPTAGLVRRVVEAAARTSTEVKHADTERERAAELDATIETLSGTATVANEMGRLLSVQGFERWLLQAALEDLVLRATERLRELSGGQFSLECDEGEFYVRDHRNADERRGVRTLSGGETFLASLALALALAENIADLAAEGAPRLESIFLDEGFGTLDLDTLDLVAASVEELSASGRFVAIVTHIRELADRVPVRFEVSRGATSSRVARVEA